MPVLAILLIFCAFSQVTYGRKGFGPGEQDWGYVTVRPKAHMFWWLYETTADVQNITERPLVIWLQGGPGSSSTGYGNFVEIGPLNLDLKPRNHTWVKHANVLFIDNPVGTGFSYTELNSTFATTNQQIAEDLVEFLERFFLKRPEFINVPLYITSESYGGKMAVDFALELFEKIKQEKIRANLKGVSLIDSWISPMHSVINWAPFLYHVGAVDQNGYDKVNAAALMTKEALDTGKFLEATQQWGKTEEVVLKVTNNIDFYNILKKVKHKDIEDKSVESVKISFIMNRLVKTALRLNTTWGKQKNNVFKFLKKDFMKPVVQRVEKLLNDTDIKLQVVTGQLDLIVDTPGTLQWVDELKWIHSDEWKRSPRDAFPVRGINEGYRKVSKQFSMYWVNRAGHMVPSDNPDAMSAILEDLLKI